MYDYLIEAETSNGINLTLLKADENSDYEIEWKFPDQERYDGPMNLNEFLQDISMYINDSQSEDEIIDLIEDMKSDMMV